MLSKLLFAINHSCLHSALWTFENVHSFSEHKYEIVKRLQARKHICGMTGDGVNDAPALKKADIGIAVADATDAARSASDIVLTEPGLSVIISAVLTSRAIFQRMKNYTVSFIKQLETTIISLFETNIPPLKFYKARSYISLQYWKFIPRSRL